MAKFNNLSAGARFNNRSFIQRPTAMSDAMARAGVIPGTHMVMERARSALLRHTNDNLDCRPSVRVAF